MARKLEVSELMTVAVERNLLRHGIDRIQGHARLLSSRRVEVQKPEGERLMLEADVVLLACGSRPRHPENLATGEPHIHDSENILEIARAPTARLVMGWGPAGCEFAPIFAALGSRVTLSAAAICCQHWMGRWPESSPNPSTRSASGSFRWQWHRALIESATVSRSG